MAKKSKKNGGSTAPMGFPDKQWNLLREEWRDALLTKDNEELEKEIIKAVRSLSADTASMKEDPTLLTLQEDLKALKGGWNEQLQGYKAQIDYCVYTMNERGVPIAKDTITAANKAKKDSED